MKKIKLCEECFYDYKAGGIQFKNDVKIVKVKDVIKCDRGE